MWICQHEHSKFQVNSSAVSRVCVSEWCTWREDVERNRRTTRAGGFSYACDPVEGILAQPHTSTNVVKI